MRFDVPSPSMAGIGIKICEPAARNWGLGPLAITLLLDHPFAAKRVDRVVLDTNLVNVRAQKVDERQGFRRLGVRQDAFIDQLGQPQSAVDDEITADDWRNLRR